MLLGLSLRFSSLLLGDPFGFFIFVLNLTGRMLLLMIIGILGCLLLFFDVSTFPDDIWLGRLFDHLFPYLLCNYVDSGCLFTDRNSILRFLLSLSFLFGFSVFRYRNATLYSLLLLLRFGQLLLLRLNFDLLLNRLGRLFRSAQQFLHHETIQTEIFIIVLFARNLGH
jgi:hypothetical protein